MFVWCEERESEREREIERERKRERVWERERIIVWFVFWKSIGALYLST